ncbi:ribonuclease HII [Candidatus Woesearchaeota archaeon CG10_big_fil_rev_8_21_14_0_10_30_7]|nr:MAG: ribonuclease HII [Candidatus Woesearchaeota archaeon CG10_big_fil_rev_8_21_14_0_10_30_7]
MIRNICGCEEAGRGPLIGPLVMVGLVVRKEKEKNLINIGVKDSKQLTPLQRERMYDQILEIAEKHKIIILEPKDIDNTLNTEGTNLNWLEADTSALIVNELQPDEVILDCPSTNTEAYHDYFLKKLNNKIPVLCAHHADENFPIVSAASIIAKVTRDAEIRKIQQKYNIDFGSGYPSDPKTIQFLKENYDKYPEIFRKTWSTYKNVIKEKTQTKLI